MVLHTGQEIKAGSLHPSGCSCFECFKAQTAAKARRQAGWQMSDQYYLNTVLDGFGVRWDGPARSGKAAVDDIVVHAANLHATGGARVPLPLELLRRRRAPNEIEERKRKKVE